MNDAFAAFLHALPVILGFGILIGCLYGFWRGLTLRPKERDERSPDPVSPGQALLGSLASPPVWPRWLRRLFGRT
jgi:hypothetical protein